jgi:SAM-dependent methyltransferase
VAPVLDASRYDTDKAGFDLYLRYYEEYFAPLWDREIKLLELGINKGGSLLLWRDHFPRGTIVGLDLSPVQLDDQSGRVFTYQGAQQDTALLDRIARERAPQGFDVIIDDCAHIGAYARASFWHLFDHHLKPGGLYVIEDWGTGYWGDWPDGAGYRARKRGAALDPVLERWAMRLADWAPTTDRWPLLGLAARALKRALLERAGRSHQAGMVGFVKELVDECGISVATAPRGTPPWRTTRFRDVRITPGQVFVVKASPPAP